MLVWKWRRGKLVLICVLIAINGTCAAWGIKNGGRKPTGWSYLRSSALRFCEVGWGDRKLMCGENLLLHELSFRVCDELVSS